MKVLLTMLLMCMAFVGVAQTTPPPVTTQVTLDGTGSKDADTGDKIVSYFWRQVSGPATPTITTPALAKTDVTGYSVPGVYVYELTVTDTKGATGKRTASVTVYEAANRPPEAIITPSALSIQLPQK